MLEIVFFYIAATVALMATVMAMTRPNAIHALDRKKRRVGKECRSRWSPYH